MKKVLIMASILLFSVAFVWAEEEQAYNNRSVARLSYVNGNTYLQRAADLAYEEGQVNAPITEGDRLGTTDGRVEVGLGLGNFLRLNSDTKVDFLNLPKKNTDQTRLKVWTGSIYLSLQSLIKEKCYEVHTSDASIYVLEKGLFRVDVLENQKTEVQVFQGAVEVAGEGGSNILSSGQRIEVAAGRFLSRPGRLMAAAEDSFDAWNTEREALLDKQLAEHNLPEDLWEYEPELDQYGDWRDMPPYGHVWIPRGLGPDWRPYYYGRWVWIPFCGWTWVGYDPWGWAPYHYGRWQWDPFFGWYWIPTNIWGPAWVSWWWGWDYYGWAPLGWYGYPGVIIHNRYYDRYHGDYPYNSRALVVVHKNQLKAPDVSRVSVSTDKLRAVDKITMTTDARLAPRPEGFRAVSIEKLDNGRVLLRNTGSVGSEERVIRSRTSSTGTSTSGQETGKGAVVRKRDSSGSQDTDRSTRQVIERPSKDSGSSNTGNTNQGQGSSQGNTTERKIRKKVEDEDSSASASFKTNSYSGHPSSAEGSSSGYTSRTSSFYRSLFRSGSSSRSITSSSSWKGSPSRSFSGSRSSSQSSGSSSAHSRSSSGSVRRKN